MLNKSQLADYFGMSEKTFHAIEARQPEVFTAYSRGKAKKIAEVAGALMKAVDRGDMRAIQFFLKTQGGWSEKNQLQIEAVKNEPEETNIEIKVVDSVCPKCKERQPKFDKIVNKLDSIDFNLYQLDRKIPLPSEEHELR